MHTQLEAGGFGRHSHSTFAVGVIESGSEHLALRHDASTIARTGDLVILNPDTAHTGVPASAEPLTYRVFYLPRALVDRALGRAGHNFHEGVIRDRGLSKRVRDVHRSLDSTTGSLCDDQPLHSLVKELWAAHGAPLNGSRSPVPADRRMAVVGDILRAHVQRPPSLAELGDAVGLSKYELSRRFAAEYGLPPLSYANEHRIRLAMSLLQRGRTIAQTAGELGYADQAHFTRAFRNARGITPGQYSRAIVAASTTSGRHW